MCSSWVLSRTFASLRSNIRMNNWSWRSWKSCFLLVSVNRKANKICGRRLDTFISFKFHWLNECSKLHNTASNFCGLSMQKVHTPQISSALILQSLVTRYAMQWKFQVLHRLIMQIFPFFLLRFDILITPRPLKSRWIEKHPLTR